MQSGEYTIRAPKSAKIPSRWIAVSWDFSKLVIRRWVIVSGEEKRIVSFESNDISQLFAALNEIALPGEKWMIVGWKMYELLCCAGMYEAVEKGDVNIAEHVSGKSVKPSTVMPKRYIGAVICQSPPTIIDARLGNGADVCLIDLGNIGLSKAQFDDDEKCSDMDMTLQAIQDYLCMIRELDMGKFCTTSAAQGLYCFKRSHMRDRLIAHEHSMARALERDAYMGGRCEAFRIGKLSGEHYYYDFRSMYVGIAKDALFPADMIDYREDVSLADIDTQDGELMHIGDVTLETGSPLYPVRHSKVVMYPIGRFRTQLCWPELSQAIVSGAVMHVHRLATYKCARVYEHFAQWAIDSFSQLESLGLSHMRPTLKQCINGSFGKIGQRAKDWIHCPGKINDKRWEQWWQKHPSIDHVTQWRAMDGVVEYMDCAREQSRSLPSMSGTMCSYGRVMLSALLFDDDLRGHIAYCDTDGIIVDYYGHLLMNSLGVVGHEIGQMSLRNHSDDTEIFGIKHYRMGDQFICAGIPAASATLTDGRIYYDRLEPMAKSLWHKRAFSQSSDRSSRDLRRMQYRHGENVDGVVYPWMMGEFDDDINNSKPGHAASETYRIVGSAYSAGRRV